MHLEYQRSGMEKFASSESTSKGSLRAKAPVPVTDFESQVIVDLNHERFNQSLTIANQLDTIGKLKTALSQMINKSSRISSPPPPSGSGLFLPNTSSTYIPSVYYDVSVQTDVIATVDELLVEIGDLRAKMRILQTALNGERAKARRIVTVCSRISSPIHSAAGLLSSPALAKWVSLGLEDTRRNTRSSRTGTFDDSSFFPMVRFPSLVLSTAASLPRRAMSEGDSPVAGLDLDMMYGSFGGSNDDVPSTPNGEGRFRIFDGDSPKNKRFGVGSYWSQSLQMAVCLEDDSQPSSLPESSDWEKMDSGLIAQFLSGAWSTGGSATLVLETAVSGKSSGQWGGREVEVFVDQLVSVSDKEISLIARLVGSSSICMFGTLMGNTVCWGNGQVWTRTQ